MTHIFWIGFAAGIATMLIFSYFISARYVTHARLAESAPALLDSCKALVSIIDDPTKFELDTPDEELAKFLLKIESNVDQEIARAKAVISWAEGEEAAQ